jgi:hypothetical protein
MILRFIYYIFSIYVYLDFEFKNMYFFKAWSEIILINYQDDVRKYWKNEEIIFYKKEMELPK